MKRKLKGFTLVELVITIAIVIILSVVSVPIYQGYTKKAKMSEGYALMGVLLSAEKTYYSEYGNFLHCTFSSAGTGKATCNEPILGVDARGNKYFTYFHICCSPGGDYDIKKHVNFYLYSPDDLKTPDKNGILLAYNVTSGSTLKDF